MKSTHRRLVQLAGALAALVLTMTVRTSADARCSQGAVEADRTVGPMVGFLPAPPPSKRDRRIAKRRLREITAMIAPYRHGVDPPRDATRFAAADGLVAVLSPPSLIERGPRYLLYRETERGPELEGVEFTFPHDTPAQELNAILPVSIARWHHTSYHCTAPPAFMWVATVFPYARDDDAIWRTLEIPKYVEIPPLLPTPVRSAPPAFR